MFTSRRFCPTINVLMGCSQLEAPCPQRMYGQDAETLITPLFDRHRIFAQIKVGASKDHKTLRVRDA